ncbi:MAG: amidohydrolase family protein [Planctomycetes bacterium]|nr:amidohydrolase family protein [Planctomycetota bacterium]
MNRLSRSVNRWIWWLAGAAAWSAGLGAQEIIAIQAGRIITAASEEISNGAIIIENGKVREVGAGLKIPYDAKVFRFPKATAMPGLIECNSTAGLRLANENIPVVPYISVLDGIDPNAVSFRNVLRDGVTAIHVIPGDNTRIGGQGAILRPAGATVDDMLVKSPSAMKISLQPAGGENRMSHMASLRRDFLQLFNYLESLSPPEPGAAIAEKPSVAADLAALLQPAPQWKALDFAKIAEEKIEVQRKPLVDVVRGKLPAFIYCPQASDVFKAFEIMEAHGVRATLVLGPEAFRARAVLAARKDLGLVVLDAALETMEKDADSGEDRRFLAARLLFDAGVRFAVQARDAADFRYASTWMFSKEGAYHLWYQAARLVQQGIPRHEAIRAITLNPAIILGLDHRMGSLEPGKDANVAIFTGDPLDARSWVEAVFIEGREAYRRGKDKELEELLRRPERGF